MFHYKLADLESLILALVSVLGIIIMIASYLYLVKLERIACECSVHPYRNYIKNYILFAIIFIVFTMFVTPAAFASMMGKSASMVYTAVQVVFGLVTFVFYIYVLQYVRYLMREKCKCSEDVRREVLYVWSILEIIIIGILFILPWISKMALSSFGIVMTSTKELIQKQPGIVREATINPVKSLRKLPASLKKTARTFRK